MIISTKIDQMSTERKGCSTSECTYGADSSTSRNGHTSKRMMRSRQQRWNHRSLRKERVREEAKGSKESLGGDEGRREVSEAFGTKAS